MDYLKKIFEFLEGKKTYVVGICGLIYGVFVGDKAIVISALGLMGLRNGLSTEIRKLK